MCEDILNKTSLTKDEFTELVFKILNEKDGDSLNTLLQIVYERGKEIGFETGCYQSQLNY